MASASEPPTSRMLGPFPGPYARDQAEDVTDQPSTARFVLRKGAVEGKWMIWDRERRGPARLQTGLACELSEEQARKLLERLTRADSGKKCGERFAPPMVPWPSIE